jgi:small GTP-binding protein
MLDISNGRKVKLQVWDTAGQEYYRSIARSYYRGSALVFLVFDITNPHSFSSIRTWVKDIQTYVDNPRLVLVGNKSDWNKRRQISSQDADDYAGSINAEYYEVSAKNGCECRQLCFLNLSIV